MAAGLTTLLLGLAAGGFLGIRWARSDMWSPAALRGRVSTPAGAAFVRSYQFPAGLFEKALEHRGPVASVGYADVEQGLRSFCTRSLSHLTWGWRCRRSLSTMPGIASSPLPASTPRFANLPTEGSCITSPRRRWNRRRVAPTARSACCERGTARARPTSSRRGGLVSCRPCSESTQRPASLNANISSRVGTHMWRSAGRRRRQCAFCISFAPKA